MFYCTFAANHTFVSDDSITSGSNLESRKVMQHSDDSKLETDVDSAYDAYIDPPENKLEQRDYEVNCIPEFEKTNIKNLTILYLHPGIISFFKY